MAQRRKPVQAQAEPLPPELVEPREEVKQKLLDRITKGKELHDAQINSEQQLGEVRRLKSKWNDFNLELLKRAFTNSVIAEEYNASSYRGVSFIGGQFNLYQEVDDFRRYLTRNITSLESILEKLDLIPEHSALVSPASKPSITESTSAIHSNEIFIVHGQDDGAKETLARFISKFDLSPIILHEQANEGRTIIEKFEGHASSVGYAVVLMTPDDVGHLKDKPEQAKPRARQNVIFELGYFIGKLSRKKVCALYKEGVEIPSDYQGVIFIPMDAGGAWRYLLAKELKSAGYPIDMNQL